MNPDSLNAVYDTLAEAKMDRNSAQFSLQSADCAQLIVIALNL